MVTLAGGTAGVPTASLIDFIGDVISIPDGFLIADGSAISRTLYNDLFTLVGTSYGDGNGTTTFNIPNIDTSNTPVNISGSVSVPLTWSFGYSAGNHYSGINYVYNATALPAIINFSVSFPTGAFHFGQHEVQFFVDGTLVHTSGLKPYNTSSSTSKNNIAVPLGSSFGFRMRTYFFQQFGTWTANYGAPLSASGSGVAQAKNPITLIKV